VRGAPSNGCPYRNRQRQHPSLLTCYRAESASVVPKGIWRTPRVISRGFTFVKGRPYFVSSESFAQRAFQRPGAADETANLVWSSLDSALEGDEFELSVPGRTGKLNTSWLGWVLSGRTDQSRGVQGMRPHSVSNSS
jgi:hypothetical protein